MGKWMNDYIYTDLLQTHVKMHYYITNCNIQGLLTMQN